MVYGLQLYFGECLAQPHESLLEYVVRLPAARHTGKRSAHLSRKPAQPIERGFQELIASGQIARLNCVNQPLQIVRSGWGRRAHRLCPLKKRSAEPATLKGRPRRRNTERHWPTPLSGRGQLPLLCGYKDLFRPRFAVSLEAETDSRESSDCHRSVCLAAVRFASLSRVVFFPASTAPATH